MKHDSERDLIARAAVITEQGLLVNWNRNDKTGESYCALPGGHIDPGESAIEAVRREFEEELQAELEVGDLCFVSEQIYAGRNVGETRRHELTLLFRGTLRSPLREEDGRVLSPETSKNFGWVPLGELAGVNLRPAAMKAFLLNDNAAAPDNAHYVFEDLTDV